MVTKTCLLCSKEFKRYPSHITKTKGKYCGTACTYIAQRGRSVSPRTQFKPGQKAHNFKGVRLTMARANGKYYRLIHKPEHPLATAHGYVREHRLIAEKTVGRYLERYEIVHHIDGDTLNNEPSNLQVMTKKEHDRMNMKLNIHKR